MERDESWLDRLRSASAAVPRFRILDEIGRDGGRVTFRGWDEALAREVAIRTVDAGDGAETRGIDPAGRQLIHEALVTGRLSHPGVVPVHELALDPQGRPYFATRLLHGATFRDVIAWVARGERGFTLARAIDVLRAACDTLAHAHGRGVTHGNLAPESLVVGEFGETYVVGWGNDAGEDDVRSIGALLSELLAGREAPRELAAIGRKATADDAAARYAGMAEMAADLRAWLEQRVVRAHRTGALAELRKWVARNRMTAALLAVALVVAVGGVGAADAVANAKNRELAKTGERIAGSLADIRRLDALKSVRDLVPLADTIWPAVPERLPAMRRWLAEAQRLVDARPLHLAKLADLEASTSARDPTRASARDSWWRESLQQLVASLDALAADAPFRIGTLAEMRRRIASAETIEKRSVFDESAAWNEAIAGLAADPRFRGVPLGAQVGLVPIGRDPASGLWEFWHVESGERPQREPQTGRIVVTESMGLVFVLLPGVTLHFEESSDAPGLPTFDPDAKSSPEFRDVPLAPFFVSKFEMTQGQWLRVTGSNPSGHAPGAGKCRMPHDLTDPVELVSFEAASATMRRLGWTLPTYAQWQYAGRAGTSTQFWTGDDASTLRDAGNIADRMYAAQFGKEGVAAEDWDDGFICTSPVGRFRPNPFGLHDTIGNVEELCCEPPLVHDAVDFSPGDGARTPRGSPAADGVVLIQGGSFGRKSVHCSYGSIASIGAGAAADSVGVRPARAITPGESAASRPR